MDAEILFPEILSLKGLFQSTSEEPPQKLISKSRKRKVRQKMRRRESESIKESAFQLVNNINHCGDVCQALAGFPPATEIEDPDVKKIRMAPILDTILRPSLQVVVVSPTVKGICAVKTATTVQSVALRLLKQMMYSVLPHPS